MLLIVFMIPIILCKSLCYDVWDESFNNIPCNIYSQYSIQDGFDLFYSCCNTFPSKNCLNRRFQLKGVTPLYQNQNYTSIFFNDNILFDDIVFDEPDDYHKHIHPITNYAFFRDYSIFDFLVSDIYLYKVTCYCTQYLIDQTCEFGNIIKRNTKVYYPVNYRFKEHKLLNYKQKIYMILNYFL